VFASSRKALRPHIIQGAQGGFGSGFEHPLTGADHFLAMFAVGLWGAQMGGRPVWTLPVTFPLIMVVGGVAGMAGIPLPGIEIGIAISILRAGHGDCARLAPGGMGGTGSYRVLRGVATATRMARSCRSRPILPTTPSASWLATGMIHLFGIGVGLGLNKPVGGRLARALGALIAVGGVYFLVPTLLPLDARAAALMWSGPALAALGLIAVGALTFLPALRESPLTRWS